MLAIFARVFSELFDDTCASHPITGTRNDSRLAFFDFVRPYRTIP